jgi:hypothetical protein
VCEEIGSVPVYIRCIIVTADNHLIADILTFTRIRSLKLHICVFHGGVCAVNVPFMLLSAITY